MVIRIYGSGIQEKRKFFLRIIGAHPAGFCSPVGLRQSVELDRFLLDFGAGIVGVIYTSLFFILGISSIFLIKQQFIKLAYSLH
jgi:hypothetical protein